PQLTAYSDSISFEDITTVGVNPARILARICEWMADRDGCPRVVTEPLWPGRRAAERTEVMRHEASVNLALRDTGARLLCVYGDEALGAKGAQAVARTHPHVSGPGPGRPARASFVDPGEGLRGAEGRA